MRRRKPSIRELQKRIHQLEGEKRQFKSKLTGKLAHHYQIVSSLVALSKRYTENFDARDTLAALHDRIHAMALILQQVPPEGIDGAIDLRQFVRDLVVHLAQTYDKGDIVRQISVAEVSISDEQASPLALVLNELVSNVYRHAFSDGQSGMVSVNIETVPDNQIGIYVTDNGKGLPDGFDLDRAASLGFVLVRNIVIHQLKGQLDMQLDIQRDQGTRISIRLPVSQ